MLSLTLVVSEQLRKNVTLLCWLMNLGIIIIIIRKKNFDWKVETSTYISKVVYYLGYKIIRLAHWHCLNFEDPGFNGQNNAIWLIGHLIGQWPLLTRRKMLVGHMMHWKVVLGQSPWSTNWSLGKWVLLPSLVQLEFC